MKRKTKKLVKLGGNIAGVGLIGYALYWLFGKKS